MSGALATAKEVNRQMGTKRSVRAVSDCVGVGLSVLCMIHCLCLPFLIAFAPVLLRGLPGDDITHRSLAVVIGFVGSLAFRSGYNMHRRRWLLYLFLTGLLFISVAAVLGDEVLTNYGEAAMTVCGGLMLVTAHLFNRSFCRSCVVRDCVHSCRSVAITEELSAAGSAGDDSL
jgi:hypothetical protein